MNDFKLLGVRPKIGCHINLIKNLQAGQVYPFYSNISLLDDKGEELKGPKDVAYAIFNNEVPKDLYDGLDELNGNKIRVNISAIAGKNGSGKSSLIDLFFASIFVFSAKNGLLTPNISTAEIRIKEIESDLKTLKSKEVALQKAKTKFKADFDKAINNTSKKFNFDDAEIAVQEHLKQEKLFGEERKVKVRDLIDFKKKVKEYERMSERTKADIFFEIDKKVYVMSIGPDIKSGAILAIIPSAAKLETIRKKKLREVEHIDLNILSRHFFYTIAINYSHYALNSRYLGEWIRLLFHKNDGYRTPLVISPMRTNGNFDINSEMAFARTRLLNNVLIENNSLSDTDLGVFITENQYITKVFFALNKDKINHIPNYFTVSGLDWSGNAKAINLCKDLLALTFDDLWETQLQDFTLRDTLLNYIVKKVESITENYVEFQPGYIFDNNPPKLENTAFLQRLLEDTSHVTYKLHQAINFIRHQFKPSAKTEFIVTSREFKANKAVRFDLSLTQLYTWMGKPSESLLIQHLPPSIFTVDFRLSTRKQVGSWFGTLSSGEQQFIHTMQGIIYHINNIQSAHANDERIKYRAINIILDEIELYFHPDFQRRFISQLLQSIYRLKLDEKSHIETINLLFLTHSPFILSDIPSKNVLRLEVKRARGKSMPVEGKFETFAANIHELLANSFFIDGTSMGEFAEQKVNALIDKVNNNDELTIWDDKLVDLIGDSFLKSSLKNLISRKKNDTDKI